VLETMFNIFGKVWTGLAWLRIGAVAGCCENGNEPSDSIRGGEFRE